MHMQQLFVSYSIKRVGQCKQQPQSHNRNNNRYFKKTHTWKVNVIQRTPGKLVGPTFFHSKE